MSILSKQQIEQIVDARLDHKTACQKLVDICKKSFKPGTVIYWRRRWKKGIYIQSGVAIQFVGTADIPQVRVENSKTGKISDVDIYFIDWDRMLSQAADYEKLVNTINQGALLEGAK